MNIPSLPGRCGFTLTELLVVVAMFAIVAAAVVPWLLGSSLPADGATAEAATEVVPLDPRTERLVDLFRLSGAAVLLFGAGFWYLGVLARPGRLDAFRWSHFLLLTGTYSFFFVVFAVARFEDCSPLLALGLSAGLSLPLVAGHVASVFDLRFALTRAVPLALLTYGVVVNGAYGQRWRAWVDVGIAFVFVTVLTWTHRALIKQAACAADHRARLLHDSTGRIATVLEQAEAAMDVAATALLDRDEERVGALRERVEGRLARLTTSQSAGEDLGRRRRELEREVKWAHRWAPVRDLIDESERLRGRLEYETESLSNDLARLTTQRERHGAAGPRLNVDQCCASCGGSVVDGDFCPRCGKPAPARVECAHCHGVVDIPTPFMARGVDMGALHCMQCGEPGLASTG